MPKPFLSIGIIFRDNIRCLERCLSSLAPLRKAVPCELVMADTGSVDGSRAVAERYADILFDFPWCDDFSAARNAVMDRCIGRWYLSIDADEWLDSDIRELVGFIRANNKKTGEACAVCQRNYMSADDETEYRDFIAVRMVRMSTGLRFHGAIHERFEYDDGRTLMTTPLYKTIFHHDGYQNQDPEADAARRKRNMDLLVRELEKDPENVRLLKQCIESSGADDEAKEAYIRRGVAATEARHEDWERSGPPIFRYAVALASKRDMEELHEWAARAEELFPNSFYILIDIYYYMFLYYWKKKDCDKCVRLGAGYLEAMDDYHAGRGDRYALTASTLIYTSPKWEQRLRTMLAHAYFQTGQPERAAEMLDTADFALMDGRQITSSILLLQDLYKCTAIDAAPLLLRLYEGIGQPTPSEEQAEERKKIFADAASSLFSSLEEEEKSGGRCSCMMLAPLAGQHPLGDAAAILAAETAPEKERLLLAADKPYTMPREVLRRAILSGVSFPLRDKPLNLEEAEAMAVQLAREDGLGILRLAVDRMDAGFQQLLWAASVALVIVGQWEWTDDAQSMDLARTFARVEEAFLSHCYSPEMLCEDNILILPSMHRLGWYCARAFQALDSGDSTRYVQLLRTGLSRCPEMKAMVEYLARCTPQIKNPPQELLELAEKVRTLLAAYDPEDPAVAALKQSPVYQGVAHLIEGTGPVCGT